MFDYISQGPPTAQAPPQSSAALAADMLNGSLYVNAGGVWKPAGSGVVAAISLTGQTSASLATTLYTPVTGLTAGMYSLDWYTKLTTTGTSPVLGPLVITYKDNVDAVAQSVTCAGQTQAGANATSLTATTTGQILSGSLAFNAGSAAAIVATLTVSGTIGAAVYEIVYRLEYLG